MSVPGMVKKVRQNPDYINVTRELDRLGIDYDLCPPTGKGHPYLAIGTFRFTVPCTPATRGNGARNALTQLRRWLTAHGLSVKETDNGQI